MCSSDLLLDILRAENKCFLGFLLPTLDSLQTKLKLLRPTAKLADPLVDAIFASLVTCFAGYIEREDLMLASGQHYIVSISAAVSR